MPTPLSQNGFTANDRSHVRSATIAGTDVKVAVRKGAAGDLLLAVAARWHREVEPLRAPDGVLDCWGYAERVIRGSATTLSNHASGTALDFRARIHPLGKRGTYSARQVAAIRSILADCRGAIRWGGDYVSRADEMHIEVVASEAACARVLATFTARQVQQTAPTTPPPPQPTEEDDVNVPITPDQSGDFRAAVKVDLGGSVGYTRAWVTLGSTWGDTNYLVSALGPDGVLQQWPVTVHNNRHSYMQLPAGTHTVTFEGAVAARATIPVAAVWHAR